MQSIYQDKNSFFHDKECINGEPSSNNGYIYTLYGHLLGLNIDRIKIKDYFDKCVVHLEPGNITINRHPNKITPYFSSDEAIGAWGLGLIPYSVLKGNYFVFHGHGKPMSEQVILDFLKGILELSIKLNINFLMSKKKKINLRNSFWENKVDKMYQLAFRLSPAHVRAIKHVEGVSAHREERELFNFYRDCLIDSSGKESEKNIMWALLVLMGDHKRAKKLNPVRNFERYFGKDHPLSKAMKVYYTNR